MHHVFIHVLLHSLYFRRRGSQTHPRASVFATRLLHRPQPRIAFSAQELLKDSIQVLRQKCDALLGEVQAFESGVDFDKAMP